MNLSTLRSLQERIRLSTGPDRQLDVDIGCALLGGEPYLNSGVLAPGDLWRRKVGRAFFDVDRYTTDPDGLGACVALMREVLPGWDLSLLVGADKGWASISECFVSGDRSLPIERPYGGGYFNRANVCLSALDAIVSALVAQMEAKEAVECAGTK